MSDAPNPTKEILNLFDNVRTFILPKPTDAHLKQFWFMLKDQVTVYFPSRFVSYRFIFLLWFH